jgi:peptidyl-tRNA hydrolase, PTH1 family
MPSLRWLVRHGAPKTAQGIKLIAGLGNPGTRYAHNRHNVGFMIVERFVHARAFDFKRKRFNAQIAEGVIGGSRLFIAKPQTYMNASGEAVAKLFKYYKVEPQDLLVIYDDLDLPLGKIRIRPDGSAGGHHGMESIIGRIGTSDFSRIRVGIGRPNPDADIGHVLSDFDEEERAVMDETIQRAVEAIEAWLEQGIVVAMNRFN